MVHMVFFSAVFLSMPQLNKRLPFRFFAFGILFIFMALRYEYGNDYIGYLESHTLINQGLGAYGGSDILFRHLNLLINNFFILVPIISFFYLFVVWKLIRENLQVNQYWYAILILLINPYLFLIHLSALRQTLAICFFIFAVKYGIKRNIWLYTLFVILASGFHASAIILLPVYFILTYRHFNSKYLTITLAVLGVLLLTPVFDIIMNFTLDYFPSQYRLYYNAAFEEGLKNSLRATLISSIYFFYVIFNLKILEKSELVYGKLSLIATMISVLSYRVAMLTRIGMYFDIFLIITVPQVLVKIRNKANRVLLFAILIIIYLLRYYSFFSNPMWESFRTYRNVLFK